MRAKPDARPAATLPRRILVVAIPPTMELDVTGPLAVFDAANRLRARQGREAPYRVEVVSGGRSRSVAGESGLVLVAARCATTIRGPVDTVLVAGGTGSLAPSPVLVAWLRRTAPRARRVGSICTGAFTLAAAGLLEGHRATTHWEFSRTLAQRYPGIRVEPDPIFVRDGPVSTSAGVTAGMDLALDLVEEDLGAEVALSVARFLVVFLRRPGGQAQFSATLARDAPERRSLRDLQAWIADNLAMRLAVPDLAARAAMSPRHFARVFAQELGMTPARYVLAQRVEAARRELERTARGQDEIAVRCGFGTSERLRRAFVRILGVPPAQYRERFRRSRA